MQQPPTAPRRASVGTHWARCITIIRIPDEHGNLKTYHPGDFVPLRNQALRYYLANGQVELSKHIDYGNALALDGCGLVIPKGAVDAARKYIARGILRDIEIHPGVMGLPFPRSLLWDGTSKIRIDLVPVGFHRLNTGWQVAAPVHSYQTLARDLGDDTDRKTTKDVIRDLRVPVYDTRMVFVRRCGDTERLMEVWRRESAMGGNDMLAFLRALYIVKPTICALPPTWIKGNE